MSNIKRWVHANCRFAVFNPPQRGDRIELPNRPGQYYLVTDRPQTGSDPRGQGFWQTRVKDQEGREQMLSSDRVPSWSHFKGPNYQWHDQELQQRQMDQKRKEQQQQVGQFEQAYRFQDGQVLRERVPPMVLKVKEGAPGDMGAFVNERVGVVGVDYTSGNVTIAPMGMDDMQVTVPAAQLMQFAEPAVAAGAAKQKVTLQDGTKTDMEHLLGMTPEFNKAVLRGQVQAATQIYQNYSNKSGGGIDQYMREMMAMGFEPNESHYKLNSTEQKFDPSGGKENLRGAWQSTLRIAPPVSPGMMEEIMRIAPRSQIKGTPQTGLTVHSNPLYKNMVALGHFEQTSPNLPTA